MVNWTADTTLFSEALSLEKTTAVLCGLYFYEFVLALPYDWEIVRSRMPYAQTLRSLAGYILYTLSRYLTFVYCVCSCLLLNNYRSFDCEALVKIITFCGTMGPTCASSSLFLRAGAIWKWNRFIVACLLLPLTASYICSIRTVILVTATDTVLDMEQCASTNISEAKATAITTTLTDVTLLTFFLLGLRKGRKEARGFPLWHMLWDQGLIYLCLAIAIGVPSAVFLVLDLNEVINTIFITPPILMPAIAATRFQRALTKRSNSTISVWNVPVVRPRAPESYELQDSKAEINMSG
ncbi:unnamed protein product [Peniophora sp. CBMAI 1063]|nr:unnamed protein product [Peniophora sp. CBMAI 1063]